MRAWCVPAWLRSSLTGVTGQVTNSEQYVRLAWNSSRGTQLTSSAARRASRPGGKRSARSCRRTLPANADTSRSATALAPHGGKPLRGAPRASWCRALTLSAGHSCQLQHHRRNGHRRRSIVDHAGSAPVRLRPSGGRSGCASVRASTAGGRARLQTLRSAGPCFPPTRLGGGARRVPLRGCRGARCRLATWRRAASGAHLRGRTPALPTRWRLCAAESPPAPRLSTPFQSTRPACGWR